MKGGLAEQFGDQLAIWSDWGDRVSGQPIASGHFMMEESPQRIVSLLTPFLSNTFHNSEPFSRGGGNENTMF